MRHFFFLFIMIAGVSHTVGAEEVSGTRTDTDYAREEQWLALLDEQTAIATRTRMNADYVPGMVTVLRGNDLEARGARTVWEALALVPGMEMAMEPSGRRRVMVRGLGNTWASGNVKILLNDIAMNSAETGLADPVYNIAIEQVDRIEVIRGPGSAIYGEYAYMGVVNVVTRSDESRVFAFGGSFETAGAGATLRFFPSGSPVQASLNVAGWRSDGADVRSGPDALYAEGHESASHAPGPANEDIEAGTAVFKFNVSRFSFTAQQSQDGLGDHFGFNAYLPPNADGIIERWRHRTVNLRQEISLAPALVVGLEAGWKEMEQRRDDQYIKAGPLIGDGSGPDRYLYRRYRETGTNLGADFTYRGWAGHTALLAADSRKVRVDENRLWFNEPVGPVITIPEGTTRTIGAITLQDEYRHSDRFTLTTGVRYDDYSDVGSNYSPRIAGVWRLDERHILKAQYAQAFRPPTLYEAQAGLFFGQTLEPARIRTSELGYIFKGERAESRLTAFHSRLSDLLVFNYEPTNYDNRDATTTGLEWEQSLRPSPRWTLDGNVSWVNTEDKQTGGPFPGASRWIANLGSSYKHGRATVALQAHHVSGYEREADDERPTLNGYTTVDLTASFAHVWAPGLHLRLGVKNLFDADMRFPSRKDLYPDDYPRPGRVGWTQISYHH